MRILLPILLALLSTSAAADPLDQARATLQSGALAAAERQVKVRLQEDPEDAEARLLLGRIALDRAEPALAEESLRRAALLGAPRADWLIPLGDALLRQGRFQQALDESKPAEGDPDTLRSEIARANAEALSGLGRREAAEAAMQEAAALDPANARVAVARAGWAIAEGRSDEARSLLEAAVARDPGSAPAWEMLGALAHRAGDIEAADAAYSKAIGSPGGWLARYKRALLRIGSGDLDGAAADLDAVAEVKPGFAGLAYARGRLALAQGKPQAALAALEIYLRAQPKDPEAAYYAAVAAIALGRLAQAEELLVRVVQAAPGLPQPALLLARLRLERGDPKGAESLLRPLAGSGHPEIDRTLVQSLLAQGRVEEADRLLLDRAEAGPGDAGSALIAAGRLLRTGKPSEAAALLKPLVAASPKDGDARLLLIRALAASGDRDGALAEARALTQAAPGDARALNALGLALGLSGDADGAREALGRGLAAGGAGAADAALSLARLESLAGHREAAYAALESALDEAPEDARLVSALADLERRSGDPQAASKRLREGLAERPADLDLRLMLVRHLLREKQPAEALGVLDAVPGEQADGPAVLRLRGLAALAAGRPELAVPALERLAQMRPASAGPGCLLAQAQAGLGRIDLASAAVLDAWKRDADAGCLVPAVRRLAESVANVADRGALLDALVTQTGNHPTLIRARQAVAAAGGDVAARSALLEETFKREPDRREVLVALIGLRQRQGELDAARGLAEEWLARHPGDTGIRLQLAGLLTRQRRSEAAIAAYEAALAELPAEDPRTALAANNLAWLLRDSDRSRALSLARQAYERDPDNPAFGDTLGTLLLASGAPASGLPLLAAASEARSEDLSLRYRYAKALAEIGSNDLATKLLLGLTDRAFAEQAEARALLRRIVQRNAADPPHPPESE